MLDVLHIYSEGNNIITQCEHCKRVAVQADRTQNRAGTLFQNDELHVTGSGRCPPPPVDPAQILPWNSIADAQQMSTHKPTLLARTTSKITQSRLFAI